MLYDPKWETKTPSLAGLIAWLETMPPNEGYDWSRCDGTCLIGQYLTSIGIPRIEHCATGRGGLDDCHYARATDNNRHLQLEQPWTYGAALERARAAVVRG